MESSTLGASLRTAFAAVPDPRLPHGLRHPLPAMLILVTTAMLSGARSVAVVARWGRLQSLATVLALGFTRSRCPCGSTFPLVFAALDAVAFETVLTDWALLHLGNARAIAVDGKGLRGIHGEELPGGRLVAAYADDVGLVVAQTGGEQPRSTQHELTAAPGVLARVPLRG